jgi:hypothetical protein
LFWVFGSSAAGKSTIVAGLRGRVAGLDACDFDEVGVPPQATVEWRHHGNEYWVRRALEQEAAGIDLLVAGQTPIGELLAAPSAPRLGAIAACLLDCDDQTRVDRISARGDAWFDRAGGTLDDYLAWGEWMRCHARDPTHRLDVIRHGDQCWDRLAGWQPDDPRWRVRVVSTESDPGDVLGDLTRWIAEERARRDAGIGGGWFSVPTPPGTAADPSP